MNKERQRTVASRQSGDATEHCVDQNSKHGKIISAPTFFFFSVFKNAFSFECVTIWGILISAFKCKINPKTFSYFYCLKNNLTKCSTSRENFCVFLQTRKTLWWSGIDKGMEYQCFSKDQIQWWNPAFLGSVIKPLWPTEWNGNLLMCCSRNPAWYRFDLVLWLPVSFQYNFACWMHFSYTSLFTKP